MPDYRVINQSDQLISLLREMWDKKLFSLDIEATSLDEYEADVVGWVISCGPETGNYIPVGHNTGEQLDARKVAAGLKPILESPKVEIPGHNVKYDTAVAEGAGIYIPHASMRDTMLEVYCDGTGYKQYGLKPVVFAEFQHRMTEFTQLPWPEQMRKNKVKKNMAVLTIDQVWTYACEDGDYCYRLHQKHYDRVKASIIWQIESQLWPVVQKIERTGAYADVHFMKVTAAYLAQEAKKVERVIMQQVSEALGEPVEFQISSFPQLTDVLFNRLKYPILRRTPTGKPQADETVLTELARSYPVCRNILTYRSMLNISTYMGKTYPNLIRSDGRIHTDYNQTGAPTRFSSSNPNLQNVSIIKSWTIEVPWAEEYEVSIAPRNGFKAVDGYYLIEFDFSAIEYLVICALSGQQDVVKAYEEGLDVHVQTAAAMLGKPEPDITEHERGDGKTANYSLLYGIGDETLSLRTGKTKEEAGEFQRRFFQIRPMIAKFIRDTHDAARRLKYVTTMFQRKILIPHYDSPNKAIRNQGDRVAVNMRIQGSAGDIHKIGLIRTDKFAYQEYTYEQARVILQTHDSQTWEVHRSVSPHEIIPKMIKWMSPVIENFPRVRVDAKIGVTWGDMVKYKESMNFEETMAKLDAEFERRSSDDLTEDERDELITIAAADGVEPEPTREVKKGIKLVFNPGVMLLASEDANNFIGVLKAFPGKNEMWLELGDKQWPALSTSLNQKTALNVLKPIFPNGTVKVDAKSLADAVTA